MDISRPEVARRKKLRQALYAATAVMVIVVVPVGVSRLEPAAPRVDRDTVYLDTAQRGPMIRQMRGAGTLVPEQIRWIPATTDGTVERIVIRPGARWTHVIAAAVGETVISVAGGLVAGLVLVIVASRWLGGVLFETSPRDPMILTQAAFLLLVIAVAAVAVPTARALRTRPSNLLRAE